MLSICLMLSLGGNLYLYNQQQQITAEVTRLSSELQTVNEAKTSLEQEANQSKAKLEEALAKGQTFKKELEAFKSLQEEKERAMAGKTPDQVLDTKEPAGGFKPDPTPTPEPEVVEPVDPEKDNKPSTGGKIGNKVPGNSIQERWDNLKSGEAMDANGKYINPDSVKEGGSVNIGGQLYMMLMGNLVEVGSGGSHGTFEVGNGGGSW